MDCVHGDEVLAAEQAGSPDALSQQQMSTVCAASASQRDIGGVEADELKMASDSVRLKAWRSRCSPLADETADTSTVELQVVLVVRYVDRPGS